MNKLTELHKQFCKLYVSNGGNATQAYKTVKPNLSIKSAGVTASQLLANPMIAELIDKERQTLINTRHNKSPHITRDVIIQEHWDIKDKALVKDKFSDANKALDSISTLKGYNKDIQEDNKALIAIWQQINIVPGSEDKPTRIVEVKKIEDDSEDVSD